MTCCMFRVPMILALFFSAAVAAGAEEPRLSKNAPAPVNGGWSLVLLPDTQLYSRDHPATFSAQTEWIVRHRRDYNVQFVLHLGDIVQDNNDRQWKISRGAMAVLEGHVPYALCVGNHDMGPGGNAATRDTLFSKYFPVAEAVQSSTFGGVYDKEPLKMDNSFHLFQAGGRKWLVLCLEFGPRHDVVAWADSVVRRHPDCWVILITHAYLRGEDGQRFDRHSKRPQSAPPHLYGVARHPAGLNDGEELWRKLVSSHRNFQLVASGHVCYSHLLSSKGAAGNTVHQMLCNYQQAPGGGAGYLRLLQFLPDGTTVRATDYSPTLDRVSTQRMGRFEITLDLSSDGASDVAQASPEEPQQLVLYQSGQDGYHTYRIPGLVVTTEDTLLAFCEGRKSSPRDYGKIDLLLKRSTDGGTTWSPQQIVYEEGGNAPITIGNPCPVVDRDTGTIWLPFCRDNRDVLITHSTDDGKTWARPVDITRDVKDPAWGWYATGPGHGIQLRHRKHRGRLVVPCDCHVKEGPENGEKRRHSFIIYSDDGGQSWQRGQTTDVGMNECEVVERADGTLLLSMRNYLGKNRRAFATSDDGGVTWSKPEHHGQVYCPTCQSSIQRYSLSPTNVILYSGPSGPGRFQLAIRASRDEGKSWPIQRTLHHGPSAYSELAVLSNGNILCLYEGGKKHPREWIRCARFSLDWVTADH